MLCLHAVAEPVSDLEAVAVFENKVVHAVKDWESLVSDLAGG
jgi:hypothetical protein